ncbi:MAG: aminotransferase class III-fold pyridoxal phosphate-dependent enzyme, partial [Rhodomicrobium sp.]
YSPDRGRMFFHSSSYTANPIACAAAAANLEIWATEPVHERVASLAARQAARIASFRNDKRLLNARQAGTITALDLSAEGAGYLASVAPGLYSFFTERGFLLRPLGNTIYVMPPYCTTESELDSLYAAIAEAATAVKP